MPAGICAPLRTCSRRRVACSASTSTTTQLQNQGFHVEMAVHPFHPALCVTMLCLHPFACLACRMKFKRFGRPERPFNSSLEMVSASLPARSCLLCVFCACVCVPPVALTNWCQQCRCGWVCVSSDLRLAASPPCLTSACAACVCAA